MKKKSLFAATALAVALSAGSALAADLPSKKAPILPPPPPPPLWTGFYIGLNAGYTWNDRNVTFGYTDTNVGGYGAFAAAGFFPGALGLNNDGFIGGGQIGYNWQFGNSFVAGVEADIQGVATDTKSASFVRPGIASTTVSSNLDYLGTVRGRLGWLVNPTLLVYATGGLAYGGVQLSHSAAITPLGPFLANFGPTIFNAGTFSDTRVGWTVGGGLEWLFVPNWSAKVEYLYYDLGNVSSTPLVYAYAGGTASSTAQASKRFDGHIVRVGVNYHFNWFAPAPVPVVAKY